MDGVITTGRRVVRPQPNGCLLSPDQHYAPQPSLIFAMALRIKQIIGREDLLDEKTVTIGLSSAESDEERRIFDERVGLAEQVSRSTPKSVTDALILIMHGCEQVNIGNECTDCSDTIRLGERAIRSAYTLLVRELGVDMEPFGTENFMPEHLSQQRAA